MLAIHCSDFASHTVFSDANNTVLDGLSCVRMISGDTLTCSGAKQKRPGHSPGLARQKRNPGLAGPPPTVLVQERHAQA
jgi:hypothetical protein